MGEPENHRLKSAENNTAIGDIPDPSLENIDVLGAF